MTVYATRPPSRRRYRYRGRRRKLTFTQILLRRLRLIRS